MTVGFLYFYYSTPNKERKLQQSKGRVGLGWDLMKIQEILDFCFLMPQNTSQAAANSFLGIQSEASGDEVAASAHKVGRC